MTEPTPPISDRELRLQEDFEERAGILEFCAGLSREEAEREAFRLVYGIEPIDQLERLGGARRVPPVPW